jgi:C4-dicarboxylate-specific signal transduction histidine kinase
MENYQNIILIACLILTTYFGLSFFKQKAEIQKLKKQLENYQGQNDDNLYARGKFSELGLMSAGITHEISNPLSIILGKTTQLLRMDNSEEVKKGLEKIQFSANRIAKIIQSVRNYIYRDDNAKEDIIYLKEIIDDVLLFYGQRLKAHGIELRLKNVDKVYLSGHKGQLEQVFLNMISNAFDAIDGLPEKWIEISTVLTNDRVQIFFRDSGHGIPKEVRGKMLEPFFTTKNTKGTGLGLSLVRGIVQKHGGHLGYQDAPNTTFVLDFPKAALMNYHH